MVSELVKGGELNSGFVEIDSVIGWIVLLFLVFATVVDEDSTHFGLFFGIILSSFASFIGWLANSFVLHCYIKVSFRYWRAWVTFSFGLLNWYFLHHFINQSAGLFWLYIMKKQISYLNLKSKALLMNNDNL